MTYSIIVVNGAPVAGGNWPPSGATARTQLYAWVSARDARSRYGWDAPDGVLCIVTDPALAAMAPANHWDLCLQAPRAE